MVKSNFLTWESLLAVNNISGFFLPYRLTFKAIPPGNFEMFSHLNELDLCRLLLTE